MSTSATYGEPGKLPGNGVVCCLEKSNGLTGRDAAVCDNCKRGSWPLPAVIVIGIEAEVAFGLPFVPAASDIVTVAVPVWLLLVKMKVVLPPARLFVAV